MKIEFRQVRLATIFAAVFVIAATPAFAGQWRLNFDPNGAVSMWLSKSRDIDQLNIRVLPATGDRTAGTCYLRIDGVTVAMSPGAPYEWDFPLREGGSIPAWRPEKNRDFQKNARDLELTERFFAGKHNIEAYFVTLDDRGRTDKNKAAAPGQVFELAPVAVASDVSLTEDQLNAGHKQAYEQGVGDARQGWEKERSDLIAKLNKLSDEIAKLKAQQVAPTPKKCRLTLSLPDDYKNNVTGMVFVAYTFDSESRKVWVGEMKIVAFDRRSRKATFEGVIQPGVSEKDIRLMPKEVKK